MVTLLHTSIILKSRLFIIWGPQAILFINLEIIDEMA